jgi:sulfonate transport system substrate-binding protein
VSTSSGRTRRTAVIAATVLAVLGVTVASIAGLRSRGSDDAPAGASTLRVGDQKAGSKALLAAAGELDHLPDRIEWSEFASGPPLLEALNAGAIDIGATGDTPPIFAAAAGSKLALVAVTRAQPNGAAILVPKDSPIQSLEQLRGTKIAVAKGSSANYHLLAALRSVGLSIADVTPAYLAPADALGAFSSKSVDAWVIWDPYTAIAQAQTGARILRDGNGLIGGLGFQIAAPAALADQARQQAIGDYLARLTRARIWADSHRSEWATAWAKEAGISPAVATVTVQRARQLPILLDDTVIKEEQTEAAAFHTAKLIPRAVDIAGIVDRRFNQAVQAAIGKP